MTAIDRSAFCSSTGVTSGAVVVRHSHNRGKAAAMETGAGLPRDVLGLVLAAVVDDENEVDMGDRAGGTDSGGDHPGLVLGGNDDGNALLAPVAALLSHLFS